MNGYSKIKFIGSTKSRSMDFSDPHSDFTQPQKPMEKISPNYPEIAKEMKNTNTHQPPSDLQGEDHVNGDRFGGVVLSRNPSVSSTTSSNRFRFEKKSSSLESAVKRVFSMRRSSSVSERYCRIHDQMVSLASPINGDGEEEVMDNYTVKARSMKKKKKKNNSNKDKHGSGKILKACKRIFGF